MNGVHFSFGIVLLAGFIQCKPNGAPPDSCFYMTPRHIHPHTYRKVFPTRAMGLYNITTSADVFRPDRPIRVTLWGPPFKGFMLVAAEEGAKDWPTGIFYSEDGAAKRLNCLGRGDTVTHHNNSYKDSVSVLWYGPETMMSEQIQFIATVVVNLTIYYTNIRSGFVRLDPSLAPTANSENGPVAVTMDPWLSGNAVTQAPTNWWSGGAAAGGTGVAGGLGGLAGLLGGGKATTGTWGQNSWGGSGGSSGSSSWGATGGSGGSSSWGGSGGRSQTGSSWGGSSGSSGRSSSRGGGWGSSHTPAPPRSSGNRQQWGSGMTTASSWQYHNPGSNHPSNSGSAFDSQGNSVWTWNSGPTTETPPNNPPPPQQGPKQSSESQGTSRGSGSSWSASSVADILRGIISGGSAGPTV